MKTSGQLHYPATLLPEKNHSTHYTAGCVGSRDGKHGFGKEEEKPLTPAGIRTLDFKPVDSR